jgi:hypothetical protein
MYIRFEVSIKNTDWGDVFESIITSEIKMKSFDKVNYLLNYTKLRNIQGFVQIYINEQINRDNLINLYAVYVY